MKIEFNGKTLQLTPETEVDESELKRFNDGETYCKIFRTPELEGTEISKKYHLTPTLMEHIRRKPGFVFDVAFMIGLPFIIGGVNTCETAVIRISKDRLDELKQAFIDEGLQIIGDNVFGVPIEVVNESGHFDFLQKYMPIK